MKLIGTFKIPEYALYYLEYGDEALDSLNFNEEDKEIVDKWISKNFPNGYVMNIPSEDESYFTHYPEFGLACDVLDVEFYEP